jgi:cobalt-zinc-cadmium efflux system protein
MNHCHHSHPTTRTGNQQQRFALIIALSVTALFTIVEFVGGWVTNSLALMADAGHMLADVAALSLSLFALWFSSRPATASKTYGFFRVEIVASLLNGVALVLISVLIFVEAYHRVLNPPEVKSGLMLAIAVAGLFANLSCAAVLHRSHLQNLNIQAAYLHVMGDALGSIGAIVAGWLMMSRGWYLADPLLSAFVSVLILYSSWQLVMESINILLEGTPAHINIESVREALCRVEGVESIHDLHVWTLTSGVHAMSCHAVVRGSTDRHEILEQLSQIVRTGFSVGHTTIQIEEVSLLPQEMNSCHRSIAG